MTLTPWRVTYAANIRDPTRFSKSLMVTFVAVTSLVQILMPMVTEARRGDIRLVGGGTPRMGTVLIFYGGRWGAICKRLWDKHDAAVVCRQLGYPGTLGAVRTGIYGRGSTRIWMSDVRCSGHEDRLEKCRHGRWGRNYCRGIYVSAGVKCKKKRVIRHENTTQLESTTINVKSSINLSISPSSTWVRDITTTSLLNVTPSMFRYSPANVVRANFSSNRSVMNRLHIEPNTLDHSAVSNGNISDTTRRSFRTTFPKDAVLPSLPSNISNATSRHPESVISTQPLYKTGSGAVAATPDAVNSHIKTRSEGVFTYIAPTTTRIISGKSIESTKPNVGNSVVETSGLRSQNNTAEIGNATLEKEVTTTDPSTELHNEIESAEPVETILINSPKDVKYHHEGMKKQNLYVQQDEAIKITAIRLANGRFDGEGMVQVMVTGHEGWGAVCGDEWDIMAAMVVCRELGHVYASGASQVNYYGGQDIGKHLYSITCSGKEASIKDCAHIAISTKAACSRNTQVAGLICTKTLPDLVPDVKILAKSTRLTDRHLYYMQCAMEENCVSKSAYELRDSGGDWIHNVRRLLRFSSVIFNRGTADFKPYASSHAWEWHACHMHYHSMDVFAHYDIIDYHGNKVAEGHKSSFCLEDSYCEKGFKKKFRCLGLAPQGISPNCSDNYLAGIDCQWIDVTDVTAGSYKLRIVVNPSRKVAELNFDNNAVECDITMTDWELNTSNCTLV